MLEVHDLSVRYGQHRALERASLRVAPGEIVVILGANGAGKSTLLRAIAGICDGTVDGAITMAGEPILGLPPHMIVEHGIALVPEGRGIFGDLSVRENLVLGANPERARREQEANLARVLRLFPKLREREKQLVRTMSGGEQQMVAIGRALMSNPAILMLDEPSLGLSPLLSKELFATLNQVRSAGVGLLLVEQNARLSLAIADRGYLIENGHIVREDRAQALRDDPAVQAAYLGGAVAAQRAPKLVYPPQAQAQIRAPEPPAPEPATHVDLPPVPVPAQAAETGVSADQLLGLDIAALVKTAERLAAAPATEAPRLPRKALGPAPTLSAPLRSERLQAVLRDIEASAERASRKVVLQPLPPLRPLSRGTISRAQPHASADLARLSQQPAALSGAPAPAQPATKGEGKVELWRRRPGSDQFERMEA